MTECCIVVLESSTDECAQIPRSCERLPFRHSESLTAIIRILNGKLGSFLFTWLHFLLLLLLYCFSCVSSSTSLSIMSTSNDLPFSLHSIVFPFSHLKLVPMCLESSSILTCSYWGLISIPETLSSVFPGCTAAFLRSTRWKVYFCADNISYIPCLLNAENWTIVCGAVRVPGGSESRLQADSVKGVGFPQRWKITLSYLHRDSMGVERLHGRNEIREKHKVTVLCPLKWWN